MAGHSYTFFPKLALVLTCWAQCWLCQLGDSTGAPRMLPAGVTCPKTVPSIDRWGQRVPSMVLETPAQVKITLFGKFVKGTCEFSGFPRLGWSPISVRVFRRLEHAGTGIFICRFFHVFPPGSCDAIFFQISKVCSFWR